MNIAAGVRAWRGRWAVAMLASACLPLAAAAAEDEARTWLARMRAAALAGNYEGTLVFSANSVMSSSRVRHYFVADQVYEHLEVQDGRQQRVYRHNEEVRTVWPQSGTALVERRETLAAWSTTPQAVDPRAAENYELRHEGRSRVAGREASLLLFAPRDVLRFAQRLWSDSATGLVLRADVLGSDGHALESTAFSSVEIGVRPQPEQILRGLRDDAGLTVTHARQRRTSLDAQGWTLARPVPGFALAGCVLRGRDADPAAADGTADPPMLQAVFSDGLTHVSVFVERYSPERHRVEMQAQLGATHTAMRRLGEHWITVVGDVPPPTLKMFTEALERRR